MSQNGNTDGPANGLVTAQVLVSNVGTEQGNNVAPEGVEGVDGEAKRFDPRGLLLKGFGEVGVDNKGLLGIGFT